MTLTLLSQRLERTYGLDGRYYLVIPGVDAFTGKSNAAVYKDGRHYVYPDKWPEALRIAITEWLAQPGVKR